MLKMQGGTKLLSTLDYFRDGYDNWLTQEKQFWTSNNKLNQIGSAIKITYNNPALVANIAKKDISNSKSEFVNAVGSDVNYAKKKTEQFVFKTGLTLVGIYIVLQYIKKKL